MGMIIIFRDIYNIKNKNKKLKNDFDFEFLFFY